MSTEAVKVLRKAVNRPNIEEGTVVRFKVRFECMTRDYVYGVVFSGGSWFTTAQRPESHLSTGAVIQPRMNQAAFEAVLRSPEVHSVAVATAWEEL